MKKPVIGLIAALVAVAAIVAGCGSSSSSESTASISKTEFVKQGNAICEAGNKELNKGFASFSKEHNLTSKKPTEAQFEELAETVLIPSVSGQIEKVSALGAPEGEEEKVGEFIEHAEEALEEVEEEPSLISAEGKEEPFYTVNKEAAAIGLTACGGEGGNGGEEGGEEKGMESEG